MRCFLLLVICCSFFWEDVEKEVKSLSKSGEEAMRSEDYQGAREAYATLFKKLDGDRGFLSWQSYIDFHLNFVSALEVLGEDEEAHRVLSELLEKRPPAEMMPRVRLKYARLGADKSSPEKAFIEMSKIAALLPMDRWSREDLSFFHALCYSLDEHFDSLLKRARRYFVTEHFEEARGIYEEILAAINGGYFPKAFLNPELLEKKVRYCLAECHYSLAEYEKTLSLIDAEGGDEIDREMIYLMALCFQKQQDYEQSIECFKTYAGHDRDLNPGQHYDHALFELGIHAYKHENLERAKHYFEMLQQLDSKGKPKLVGALYLSRILLKEKAPDEVERLLKGFHPAQMRDDPLKYELYYLLGEAAFLRESFQEAETLYVQSLPQTIGCEWGLQARLKLGWCYLKLGHLEKGEKVFKALLLSHEKDAASFALAHLYLVRGGRGAEEKIEALFADRDFVLEKEHEVLLLRAEAATDYVRKRRLYLEATSQLYAQLPTYVDAWYKLGVSEFQKGLSDPEHGSLYFERATVAFEQAFPLCESRKLATEILTLEAKANFYRNSPISSLALLEKLLEQFIETCEEHEETLYLRGLVASKLTDLDYFSLAESSLKQVVELYPKGKFAADALLTLGTLYFGQHLYTEASETFLHLAHTYPASLHAADGFFWAAESLEKVDPSNREIAELREHVYQDYRTSLLAPEAYFRRFAYGEYVEGHEEAIQHLRAFPALFPHSPLTVAANFLIAMREENFAVAETLFLAAIHQFHRACDEGKLPDATTVHFYYEAKHKLAVLYQKRGEHMSDKSIALLRQIMADFEEEDHPLASLVAGKHLYDQAHYSLAKGYLLREQKTKAEQIFLAMLNRFRQRGQEEGLYLSLTWREQGKLAMECHDLETAMNCFNFSDRAGTYFLNDEQKLTLWLLKSECYQKQKDYSSAMRMLSKVINADVTSPLRIKAMYKRAEIYELQERPELVIRQLEAIAKKGGEWAILAKDKLRTHYGVE